MDANSLSQRCLVTQWPVYEYDDNWGVGRLAAATVGLYLNVMGLRSFTLAVAAVPYDSIGTRL